jgi:hypothetical protein
LSQNQASNPSSSVIDARELQYLLGMPFRFSAKAMATTVNRRQQVPAKRSGDCTAVTRIGRDKADAVLLDVYTFTG